VAHLVLHEERLHLLAEVADVVDPGAAHAALRDYFLSDALVGDVTLSCPAAISSSAIVRKFFDRDSTSGGAKLSKLPSPSCPW